MRTLEQIRDTINEVDRKMADLFRARMEAVSEVAAYKQEHELPVFDPAREQAVLERNTMAYPDDSTRAFYASFLQNTMDISKEYQKQLMEECTADTGMSKKTVFRNN